MSRTLVAERSTVSRYRFKWQPVRAPRIKAFGCRTSHPRLGVAMWADSWLGNLDTNNVEDSMRELCDQATSAGRAVLAATALGQSLHCAIECPTSATGWHVGFSDLGWSIDVYDNHDAAVAAIAKLRSCGGGHLLIHGEYSTDGEALYRLGEQVKPAHMMRASACMHIDTIKTWAEQNENSIANSIVAVTSPELNPALLVSYKYAAQQTGLGLQTLRTYVLRPDSGIPQRQFSTPNGHPLWSRPIMDHWAACRRDPRYQITGLRRGAQQPEVIAPQATRKEVTALLEQLSTQADSHGLQVAFSRTELGYDTTDPLGHSTGDPYLSVRVVGPHPGTASGHAQQ